MFAATKMMFTASGNTGFPYIFQFALGARPALASMSDDFNRANSAVSPGSNWVNQAGVMGIDSNAAYPVSGDTSVSSYNSPLSSDNQEVSCVVGSMNGSSSNDLFGLFLGASASGEMAALYVAGGLGVAYVYYLSDWTGADGSVFAGAALSYTTGDTITFRRSGSVYWVLVNGTVVSGLAFNDSTGVLPIDSSHRFVGMLDINTGGDYRRIDSWAAQNYMGSPYSLGGIAGVTYTQSNVYASNVAADWTGMNDGSASGAANQTGTDSGTGNYIRADCGSSIYIDHIVIGYDYLSNLPGGWGVTYTEGLLVQGSNNGSSWTTITTTPTYASTGSTNGLVSITINATWRYIRLYQSATDYMATTEFEIWDTA